MPLLTPHKRCHLDNLRYVVVIGQELTRQSSLSVDCFFLIANVFLTMFMNDSVENKNCFLGIFRIRRNLKRNVLFYRFNLKIVNFRMK